jgi:mono/diheme cytochrome c family protein
VEKRQSRDEIDFRETLRRPEGLFGYSFLYVLAALLALGVMYVANLTTVGKNSVPPLLVTDSSSLLSDIPFQTASVLPPVDVMQVAAPTDEMVQKGAALYRSNCSSCHGETGLGDGPAGVMLNPRPRNFHEKEGWKNGAKVSEIYRTLQDGIVQNGMASYSYMPPADLFGIAHYVRTFQESPPRDSRDDLEALEVQYRLSMGSSTPGQIPVRKATRVLLHEAGPRLEAVKRLAERLSEETGEQGGEIARRVVRHPERLAAALTTPGHRPGTVAEFVRIVSADPEGLGLSPAVASLHRDEWTALYRFLSQWIQQL